MAESRPFSITVLCVLCFIPWLLSLGLLCYLFWALISTGVGHPAFRRVAEVVQLEQLLGAFALALMLTLVFIALALYLLSLAGLWMMQRWGVCLFSALMGFGLGGDILRLGTLSLHHLIPVMLMAAAWLHFGEMDSYESLYGQQEGEPFIPRERPKSAVDELIWR